MTIILRPPTRLSEILRCEPVDVMKKKGGVAVAACRVVSRSSEAFADRAEAGRLLAHELRGLRGLSPVVLGIPRGGVVVARELARGLGGDLDVIMTHKIGAEGNSELAVGAVTEAGEVFTSEKAAARSEEYLRVEAACQHALLRESVASYRRALPATPLKERQVIVTDDGVATGLTMEAALWAVRKQQPARLIAAIPVAAEGSLERLVLHAEEVVCLHVPWDFWGVGQFYRHFDQLENADVVQILDEEASRRLHHEAG